MSEYLKTLAQWQAQVGPGWGKLLAELHTKLEWLAQAQGCDYSVSDIKEKYGTLRFYASVTDIMQDCVSHAEQQSSVTCEDCGAYGQLRRGGWLRTLCDACAPKEVE